MKYTEINRGNVKLVHAAMDKAIKAALDGLGISTENSNLRWTETGGELKLKFRVGGTSPEEREAVQRREFEALAPAFGLRPEHYGTPVRTSHGAGRLVGFQPKRSKYPFVVAVGEGPDPKKVLVTEDHVFLSVKK
jgi:hypothetical protein